MNSNLKGWVVETFAEFDSETIQAFLRMIKFAPEKAQQIIDAALLDARKHFAAKAEGLIDADFHRASLELLEVFKERFAKELAEISQ